VAVAEAQAPVRMRGDGQEPEDLGFTHDFKYLGFNFACDGDRWRHVEIRMAMAASAFGKLRHIWRDSRLSRRLKLRIYSTYTVSILTWGLIAWPLGSKERRKLAWWNAKMMARLMQVPHEAYAETVRAQMQEPEFDLIAKLRARRLRWLGHTLRLQDSSLLRQVTMRGEDPLRGSVLDDEALPAHDSMEELAAMAGDHSTEEGKARCAAWGAMCAQIEGKSGQGFARNTAQQTAQQLAEIGEVQIRCYTDGGCDGNGAGGRWGAAGWGAHILRTTEANDEASVCAELWGPVETDPDSVWYCGAERGTNNTGEIIGIGQALMWLRDVDESSTPAAMLFDSCYAANMVTGRWQPNKNIALISWARRLLKEATEGRQIHWVHVKGHSEDGGNDRADELVQWGKNEGPYCRLRAGDGEGETRYRGATAEENAAKVGGAATGANDAARRLRRGDVLVKYGLIDGAAMSTAREASVREALQADADALVARARGKGRGKDKEARGRGVFAMAGPTAIADAASEAEIEPEPEVEVAIDKEGLESRWIAWRV
jgi:ribonuclease HI